MYIEEKALDLTVKKAPVRARSEVLLDLLGGYEMLGKRGLRGLTLKAKDSGVEKKGKGKKGKGQTGQSSVKKKGKKSTTKEDTDIDDHDGDNDIDDGENNNDNENDSDDDDGGSSSDSHGDMSRQHSREDFLHAEMLLSLGSQGEGASREGSPELGKKTNKKKGKKRKIMSKESFKEIKIPRKDVLDKNIFKKKDAYMESLNKIIKKVDRRISQSDKVIVESMESGAREEDRTALQKKWEEQLQASKMEGVTGTVKATMEEKGTAKLSKEASQKLREVRGITKAMSEAQKDSGKCDLLAEESNATESKTESMEGIETENLDKKKDEKPDLESMLKASMISSPYSCVICGLRYSLKDALIAHLKTHCDYLPFKCGICLSTFEKASFLLRNHMKNHMHEHKYVCDRCGTLFSIPLQLMQHVTAHDNAEKHERSEESPSSSKPVAESNMEILSSGMTGADSKADGESTGENLQSESSIGSELVSEKLEIPSASVSSGSMDFKTSILEDKSEQELFKKTYLSPFVCNLCDTSVSYGQELNSHVRCHFQEQVTEKEKVIRPSMKKEQNRRYVYMGFGSMGYEKASSQQEEDISIPKDANEKAIETVDDEDVHDVKGEPVEKTESTKSDGKASILAKALQTAPRYGNNLVVDKATGLIYHITNIPESVKEYQSLSLTGGMQIKPEDKEAKETETKDSNDSFNASQVVHVPVSNSSMSFPILIRKPVTSTWTLARPKIEPSSAGMQRSEKKSPGDLMSSSKLPKAPIANEDSTTKTSLGTADPTKGLTITVSKQKFKVARFPQETTSASQSVEKQDSSNPALDTISDPVPTIETQTVHNSTPLVTQTVHNDTAQVTQTAIMGTSVNIDQIPQVSSAEMIAQLQNATVNRLEGSKVDQFDKGSSCIVEISQGGVTQLVRIAIPQTVPGTASKPSQDFIGSSVSGANQQLQPSSVTQSLALSQLVQGATNSSAAALAQPIQGTSLTQPIQGTALTQTIQGKALTQTLQGSALTQPIHGYASQLGQGLTTQTLQNTLSLGTQPLHPFLQVAQEGILELSQSAVKPLNTVVSQTGAGATILAQVPHTKGASNLQGVAHPVLQGGNTRTETTLMPVVNGNINIPCVLQTAGFTKQATPIIAVTAALNTTSSTVVSSTNSSVANVPGTNLLVLPTLKTKNKGPALGKNIPPGAWCSEILSGAFSIVNKPKLPMAANVIGANQGNVASLSGSISPVLGNTHVLLPGQGLHGIGTPIIQQESNKTGLVQVIPQSVAQTIAQQLLMPLNTLGLQAGTQIVKPQSSSPLNVVLTNDITKQRTLTAAQHVLLNVPVGEHGTKSATLWPGNIPEKQTPPSSVMPSQNVLLGPFVQKLPVPESVTQVISQPNNHVAGIAGNKSVTVSSMLAKNSQKQAVSVPSGSLATPLKAETSSQPQFLMKVPGIGDVLYSPTQTQHYTTIMSAAKTEASNLDISKLIQNSLKAVQTTAAPSATQASPPPSTIASTVSQGQVFPVCVSPLTKGDDTPVSDGDTRIVYPAQTNKTLVTMTNVLPPISTSTAPTLLALSNTPVSGAPAVTLSGMPTIVNSLQPNSQTSSALAGPQIAIATCSTPTQFSIPLCVKTSTGGGIATIQVGDKVYPLSLVFYQPVGSSQAVTSATVSIATSAKPPVSTVSVLSTSTTAILSASPKATDITVKPSDSPITTPDETSQDETHISSDLSVIPSIVKSEAITISGTSVTVTSENVSTDAASPWTASVSANLPSTSSSLRNSATIPVYEVTSDSDSLASASGVGDNSVSSLANSVETSTSAVETSASSVETSTSAVETSASSVETSANSGQTSEEEEGLFLCPRCRLFFPFSEMLNMHIDNHDKSKERFHKCEHCEAVFYDANQMRQHNLTHFLKVNKDPEVFVCPKCDIAFTHSNQLKFHCAWAHKKNTFACQHCDQIFLQEVALQAHSFHHPYLCQICKSRFDSRKAVEFHVMCHDIGPNSCTFCNEIFSTKTDLKEHLAICPKMQISTRYLWFCENCKLPLSSRKKLEEHLLTHYSRTVYFCGVCKRGFLDMETAKSHMHVHKVMLLRWSCHFCGERFTGSDLAAKHVGSCSANIDSNGKNEIINEDVSDSQLEEYSKWDADISDQIKRAFNLTESRDQDDTSNCSIEQKCDVELMQTADDDSDKETESLVKPSIPHILKMTPVAEAKMSEQGSYGPEEDVDQGKFRCSVCGLLLQSCFRLKQHKVITHSYSRTNRNAYQHVIENFKRLRSYICKICNKSFQHQSTLLWHMRLHYNRKFSCKLCTRKFETRAALKAHGRKVHTFQDSTEIQLGEINADSDIAPKAEFADPEMELEGDDELEHSTSEDELHIDEESDDINIPGETDISTMSVKERLALKCKTGNLKMLRPLSKGETEKERRLAQKYKMKIKTSQIRTLSKGKTAVVKAKKEPRKKVFGCGLCGKSYFKLMKLTKHVWEHEQLEGQGQAQVSIATPENEAAGMETSEGEIEKKLVEVKGELCSEEKESVNNESELNKFEGKYMCALCKIKYHESADLFKHAKVHLDLKAIATLAKRKLKHAQMVTGDPSKPATVYIELDNKGNLVRRIPPVTSKIKEETKGCNSDESEGGSEGKQEPMTVVVCNLCKKTVYRGPNDTTLDQIGIGSHKCEVKAEETDTK